jgi:hypothetical protein
LNSASPGERPRKKKVRHMHITCAISRVTHKDLPGSREINQFKRMHITHLVFSAPSQTGRQLINCSTIVKSDWIQGNYERDDRQKSARQVVKHLNQVVLINGGLNAVFRLRPLTKLFSPDSA